jgi:hypothetical protein
VCYAKRSKKLGMKSLIFPTPIRLNAFDLSVKETLNMSLKLHKNALGISAVSHKINPREFAKVINKTYVIFVATNRNGDKTPNIRINKFKW